VARLAPQEVHVLAYRDRQPWRACPQESDRRAARQQLGRHRNCLV
jgi:hypothetical protein